MNVIYDYYFVHINSNSKIVPKKKKKKQSSHPPSSQEQEHDEKEEEEYVQVGVSYVPSYPSPLPPSSPKQPNNNRFLRMKERE